MNSPAGHDDSTAGHVRLRYWASARAAAGVTEDVLDLDGPASLADVVTRAKQVHAGSVRFAAVLDVCSVLIGDRPVASEERAAVEVRPGDTVEFLPPFAGG